MTKSTATIENRIIRPVIAQVEKAYIDTLLDTLKTLDDNHYLTVSEGDDLYVAPTPNVVVPLSQLRTPGEVGDWHSFADFYDLHGHRLTLAERPDTWLAEQSEIRDPGSQRFTLNAVSRLGDDYLMVGRGDWVVTGETTIDGERALEFETVEKHLDGMVERSREEKRAFLDANPIIEQSKPAWAIEIGVEQGENLGETLIDYGYPSILDGVLLVQEATLKGGELTFEEVEFRDDWRTIPAAQYGEYAKQLREFADALDAVHAQEVR